MAERAPLREMRRDEVHVHVFPDRAAMGAAAGTWAAGRLRRMLAPPGQTVRVLFAAAPSQAEMLATLSAEPGIDWQRVHALHLDEYLGLAPDDQATLGSWLEEHIWKKVRPGRVDRLDSSAADPAAEAGRYGRVLAAGRVDLALLGVGENGHVAFNEPDAWELGDPELARVVTLAQASREQQVHDRRFPDIASVPVEAITVTMSAILQARSLVVTVPGSVRAAAIARALDGPVGPSSPASALRLHEDVDLFLDADAAAAIAQP